MKKERRHVGDDALALMAAAKAHRMLAKWLPSATRSQAYFDVDTHTFLCILIGPVDLTLVRDLAPQPTGHVALYQVLAALGDDDDLYFGVQPLEVVPLAGAGLMRFDAIEVLDCPWDEAAGGEHQVEPRVADRAN